MHARILDCVKETYGEDAIPTRRAAFVELLHAKAIYESDFGGRSIGLFHHVRQASLPDTSLGAPLLTDIAPPDAHH